MAVVTRTDASAHPVAPPMPATSSSVDGVDGVVADDTVAAERDRRRQEVALGYRLLAALRWGDLGDGHITGRDPGRPDHFWLLTRGVPFGAATVDDLVLVGPDGAVVEGDGTVNETAHRIHWPVHEARPTVIGAVHTRTPWGTPFCAERRLVRPITQEACYFVDDVALFDDEEVQAIDLDCGRRIAAALGPARAVLLANHGLLTVGPSVGEAVAAFVLLERVCEAELKAPGAKPISPGAARRAKAALEPERALAAAFTSLVAHHLGDPAVVRGGAPATDRDGGL